MDLITSFLYKYEVLLPLSVVVARTGLICMAMLAFVRLFSETFDSFLSYGKLRANQNEVAINNKLGWKIYYPFSMAITFGLYVFLASIERFNPSAILSTFSLFYLFHLARRSYETIAVQKLSDYPMPIYLFFFGMVYYAIVPIGTLLELQDLFEFHGGVRTLSFSSEGIGWTISGLILFIFANYKQHEFHIILANLRNSSNSSGQRKFLIPRGGWFELVSCPHYFAELLIYVSFLLMTHLTLINLWYLLFKLMLIFLTK